NRNRWTGIRDRRSGRTSWRKSETAQTIRIAAQRDRANVAANLADVRWIGLSEGDAKSTRLRRHFLATVRAGLALRDCAFHLRTQDDNTYGIVRVCPTFKFSGLSILS